MADDVIPVPASRVDRGYDSYDSDFRSDFVLHEDAFNVTPGINKGLGPRFGMAPIPTHNDNEAETDSFTGGLQRSEAAACVHYDDRKRFFGIVPLSVGLVSAIGTKKIHYFFIMADDQGQLHVCPTSTYAGTVYSYINDIGRGFVKSTKEMFDAASAVPRRLMQRGPILNRIVNDGADLVALPSSVYQLPGGDYEEFNFASFASFSYPGRSVPLQWFVGRTLTTPTALDPGQVNFWSKDDGTFHSQPPFINQKNFKKVTRALAVYNVSSNSRLNRSYHCSAFVFDTGSFIAAVNMVNTTNQFTKGSNTFTEVAPLISSPAYGSVHSLFNDDQGFFDNNYAAIFVAAKKAFMFYCHDYDRNIFGDFVALTDPTVRMRAPVSKQTKYYDIAGAAEAPYSETYRAGNAFRKETCWDYWPAFVEGTALATEATALSTNQQVTLGAVNSGILRANTVYEFTYAVYDKKLDIETNVGVPARVQVGAIDFVAISLMRDTWDAGASKYEQSAAVRFTYFPIISTSLMAAGVINDLELRFYYRALGSYEWLPALFIDAAKLFIYPNNGVLWMCRGTAVGTVGGQPGGFNDYSPLTPAEYNDVKVYKGCVFWFAPKQFSFSLKHRPLAFPLRNTFNVETGEFKGGLVQQFRGESEQSSQIFVFGSAGIYKGNFSGELTQQAVQLSPSTVATFGIEGSDFILEDYTSNTAFSHRSACIADGDLYYWGQEGVFFADGVAKPIRISANIEPALFTVYDPNRTDEIHCVYVEQTKEIHWFYPPKVADDYATHILILNTLTSEFYPGRMTGKVDAAFKVTIEQSDVTRPSAGKRIVMSARAGDDTTDVQRGYFYDVRNKCGDFFPETEFMVKEISTPAAGQRRLTLAAGYDAANFATIAVGDFVALPLVSEYAQGLTDGESFIGEVVALGVGTIDVTLPSGVAFDAAETFARDEYVPMYHQTLNSFQFNLESQYWLPGTLKNFWYFLYLYGLFKLNPLLPCDEAQALELKYKTILNVVPNTPEAAAGFYEDTLTLRDNSDGNYQVYKALVQSHAFAQGLKFVIAGGHFAGSWVLQYLELLVQDHTDDQIKMFEE